MKLNAPKMEDPELNVAPLIDMVFLLLVYFMVSASLAKSEGDLGVNLPGPPNIFVDPDPLPDEQVIEIQENGRIYLNQREYDSFDSQELPQLSKLLTRYKKASNTAENKALITITADAETKHQRVVDVLNACSSAGIKNITFFADDPQ